MVESKLNLDHVFLALADSTRRSILEHVVKEEMSIGEIAHHYELTFAAISKHIKVLEKARLITKKRRGKEQVVMVVPASLKIARNQIARYEKMWEGRFARLDDLLEND